MELFDKLVIPQPSANLEMYSYLLMVALSILMIYSGILLGSSVLSVYFKRRAGKDMTDKHFWLAKDMIDLITTSKTFAFGMGIIPFLAVIMSYIQLLNGTNAPVVIYLLVSFVLFVAAISLIYIYQHAMDLSYIFGFFKTKIHDEDNDKTTQDFISFREDTESKGMRTGFWGVVILMLSLWFLISSLTLAVEHWRWSQVTNPFYLLMSFSSLVKFLHFVTASVSVTAIAFLIKKFKWQDEPTFADETYTEFAKRLNLSAALIFTLIQPLFIVLNLIITPKTVINYTMFGVSVFALIVIFLLAHFIYMMVRYNQFKYISPAFYMIIAVIALIQVKEQAIFAKANQEQMVVLAKGFEAYETEVLAAAGISKVEINGQDIYNAKCMACHAYDTRLVGPPHKDVLPKYKGKMDALVRYILKPTKVDPAYPAMTPPGLKPKEAEAVAKFMLEELESKHK